MAAVLVLTKGIRPHKYVYARLGNYRHVQPLVTMHHQRHYQDLICSVIDLQPLSSSLLPRGSRIISGPILKPQRNG